MLIAFHMFNILLTYCHIMERIQYNCKYYLLQPIPVAARSKAWDCDRSLAGNVGSNPAAGMDVCLL
jgi:hypothetical protein